MMFLCAFSCGIVTWTKRNEWPLIVILAPFALAFWSIGSHVESHVRFYSQALPVFSIPIALSCAGILQNNKRLIHMCCLLFPIIAAWASPHWSIEREISSKMLKQAFPEVQSLQKMQTRVGHAVHIQTLPLTNIERKIAADWDTVCTQALKKDGVWKLY
jgi:hypothetical protein